MRPFAVVATARGRCVDRTIMQAPNAASAIYFYMQDKRQGDQDSLIVSAKPADKRHAGVVVETLGDDHAG